MRLLGSFITLISVLFYGASVVGKEVVIKTVEKDSRDLITIFREVERGLNSALGNTSPNQAFSLAQPDTPMSIVLLSGIVLEEKELMKAFNLGDGDPMKLDGPRSFDDVLASRSTYFSRLREVFPREKEFWGKLVDGSARAADIALRLEELAKRGDPLGVQAEALKARARRILDIVKRMQNFAQQEKLKEKEIGEGLMRVHRESGGRPDGNRSYTSAMELRQSVLDLHRTDVPAMITQLE